MQALRRYGVLDTAPEDRFDRITVLVSHIFRVPTAVITLVDEHRQWFKSRTGLVVAETARDIAFCNTTIQGSEVVVVPDAERDERFAHNPLVTSGIRIRFYAGAPLRTADGFNIGTLAIIDYLPRTLADWEKNALAELANFVMSEIELWRRLSAEQEGQQATVDALVHEGRVERELAERRFRALIENASDMTLLLDARGRVTHASRAAVQVLGFDPAELLGKDALTFLANEDCRAQLRAGVAEVLAQNNACVRLELTATHKTGATVHLSMLLHNLFEEPVIGALFVHARDVTSEVSQRANLVRLNERLGQAEKMEAIGRLAGGIAHDFNNLISIILGYASLALEANASPSSIAHALTQIVATGERGSALTQQILAFSRHHPTETTLMDLNELVRGVLDMLARVLGEQIKLEFRPATGLPFVCVDRVLLEQVLFNLCTNSRDAIQGEGRIEIRTCLDHAPYAPAGQTSQPASFVMLAIRDTGAGMSEAVRGRVFEPFFTTKPVGKGTGLGLAMAYGVVHKHGGSIELDSALGKGTEVRIRLPAGVGSSPPTNVEEGTATREALPHEAMT
ncbi:MAG: Blue-light-activated protein [Myxococcaceae bacterium]|nr:Blue-light-activated protein [Myxococcaceae bacterium]